MGFISNTQLKSVVKKQVDSLKDGSLVPAKSLLTDNFDTKMVLNDQSAYNFRPTASMGTMSLEVGSPCKEKAIIGGSLGWNQGFNNNRLSSTYSSLSFTTFSKSGVGFHLVTGSNPAGRYLNVNYYANTNELTLQANHVYIFWGGTSLFDLQMFASDNFVYNQDVSSFPLGRVVKISSIGTSTFFRYILKEDKDSIDTMLYPQLIDLTACLGPTIADYIYSLEQATTGAGVAWFRRYFPKPYYAYKAIGDFVNVQTSGKKITRFNLLYYDGETTGVSLTATGGIYLQSGRSTSDYIRCLPNTSYYLKSPDSSGSYYEVAFYDANKTFTKIISSTNTYFSSGNNAYYFRCSYSNNMKDKTCINFHYDGERDGEYEPFSSTTVPVDPITLIGIPKLDANNNLYFEGDTYEADGTVTGIWSNVQTMASEDITLQQTYTNIVYYGILKPNDMLSKGAYLSVDLINNGGFGRWKTSTWTSAENIGCYTTVAAQSYIWFGFAPGTTLEQARAKLNGMKWYYPLATPTTSSATPFTEVQDVDNWGTEEFLLPENDTRPVVVPVGHDTDYLPDYKAKVEVAADMPGEDGDYILHREDGECSYTPLVTSSILITYQDGTTETVRVLS